MVVNKFYHVNNGFNQIKDAVQKWRKNPSEESTLSVHFPYSIFDFIKTLVDIHISLGIIQHK